MQTSGSTKNTSENGMENLAATKNYGQNKIKFDILAISFVFSPHFRPKLALLVLWLCNSQKELSSIKSFQNFQSYGIHHFTLLNFSFDVTGPPLVHKNYGILFRTFPLRQILDYHGGHFFSTPCHCHQSSFARPSPPPLSFIFCQHQSQLPPRYPPFR